MSTSQGHSIQPLREQIRLKINEAPLIRGLAEILNFFEKNGDYKRPDAHVRNWFRGQSRTGWDLIPGVYRPSFNFRKGDKEDDEDARLRTEKHLTQDFRVMSAGIRKGSETDVELYFLQQHYRMPTRLLDWSNNPLAALYFVVRDETHDQFDGELIAMDAYELAALQSAKYNDGREFFGIATSRNDAVKAAVGVIAEWQSREHFPRFVIPIRPDYFDQRISLQRSCFTFHPPDCQMLRSFAKIRTIDIPSTSKAHIREQLAALGVDEFTIFGDLEHLAARLSAAYLKHG